MKLAYILFVSWGSQGRNFGLLTDVSSSPSESLRSELNNEIHNMAGQRLKEEHDGQSEEHG
jgi:hypothetical protein